MLWYSTSVILVVPILVDLLAMIVQNDIDSGLGLTFLGSFGLVGADLCLLANSKDSLVLQEVLSG